MYTFTIKDNGPDIHIAVARSLLALAGIASVMYHSNQFYFINLIAAALMVSAALFVKSLLLKLKISAVVLVLAAAIIVFAVTGSTIFPVVLVICGVLTKKLYLIPTINVNTKGVSVIKMLSNTQHEWSEFNNIILKDNLLTLDFKNNKLLQVTINESESTVDEYSFNTFCSGFVGI